MARCQKCGEKFKIDIIISDELWKLITPNKKNSEAGLLCEKCIMEELENIMDYSAFKLEPITTNLDADNYIKNYIDKNYKNKIALYIVKKGDVIDKVNPDLYNKRSYASGHIKHKNADIFMGYNYDNTEQKIAVFFHELAHVTIKNLKSNLTTYEYEKEVWKYGLKLAKKENITFKFSTFRFMIEGLWSYKE